MDVLGSEDTLAAVQQPVTGPLNVSPFPPAVPHPWWSIAVEAPWLCRAVSDTPALIAIRTPAECFIAGVPITADVTIIAIAIPVVPDVPEAVGSDVDRSRILRMPDGPLDPAVLDTSPPPLRTTPLPKGERALRNRVFHTDKKVIKDTTSQRIHKALVK